MQSRWCGPGAWPSTPVANTRFTAARLRKDPARLEQRRQRAPAEPGCYLLRDAEDRILYHSATFEESAQPRRSYSGDSHEREPSLISLMVRPDLESSSIATDSEPRRWRWNLNLNQAAPAALQRACSRYGQEIPSYLCITSEPYPRIFITPRRALPAPWDRFYGPTWMWPVGRTLVLSNEFSRCAKKPSPL